jgi:EVE domain
MCRQESIMAHVHAFVTPPLRLFLKGVQFTVSRCRPALVVAMVTTRGNKARAAPSSQAYAADVRSQSPSPPVKRMKKSAAAKLEDERVEGEKRCWLFKSEPESRMENGVDMKFGIDDLQLVDEEWWDGVRNFEARNNMQRMRVGDLGFFYVSPP